MELFEREAQQQRLDEALVQARSGAGQIVLVGGEAGIGKTALISTFVQKHGRGHEVLWGACDPLFMPRPLGPLYDVARALPELAGKLESGANWLAVSSALLEALKSAAPGILVIEDIHWADEATLDLLKFLGRRIAQTHTLLILTYRDDEVDRQQQLRSVLGDFPPAHTIRLPLAPLSERAVETLARRANHAADGLYAATKGNPFFLSEILKSDAERVPATVRDAVLTRAARLSLSARAILELVSINPSAVDLTLVDDLLQPEPAAIDACVEGGFLLLTADGLVFRHELARRAIEEALPRAHARALHAQTLQAMLHGSASHALLVHHAIHAANSEAVLEYAPPVARQASQQGAHREATRYYRAALDQSDLLSIEDRADLFDQLAFEYYLTGGIDLAIQARQDALALWRQSDRDERIGAGLRWLSRLYWFQGNKQLAFEYATQAIQQLEPRGPGLELAMAYSNRSQLFMLAGESAAAIYWGEKALALAEELQATEIIVHALTNIGTAELMAGDQSGKAKVERSLAIARAHEMHDHAARCYANLISMAIINREYQAAERMLNEGLAFTVERDMDSYSVYLRGWRARWLFEQGRWQEAATEADNALALHPGSVVIALPAIIVLGHLRVRLGDVSAVEYLDRARALALPTGEIQRIGPVSLARAEAAWWAGDPAQTIAEAQPGYELALHGGDDWSLGALAYWLWRAGQAVPITERIPAVYRMTMSGDWSSAAQEWQRLGCPFERALALADGDRDAQLAALDIFDALGARPAAQALRAQLRRAGEKKIPRGPRPSTRANPQGLTTRELQILGLLAEGLSNLDIAQRLSISAKTVDHHISSILSKLDARSRMEAVALARTQNLLS